MHTTVLLADRDRDQHTIYAALLERAGFTIIHAYDGPGAVELARAHAPALIVTELNLPRLAGADMLSTLAGDPRTLHIPVVVVTADVLAARVDPGLPGRTAAWLHKPCLPSEVTARVRALLSARAVEPCEATAA